MIHDRDRVVCECGQEFNGWWSFAHRARECVPRKKVKALKERVAERHPEQYARFQEKHSEMLRNRKSQKEHPAASDKGRR